MELAPSERNPLIIGELCGDDSAPDFSVHFKCKIQLDLQVVCINMYIQLVNRGQFQPPRESQPALAHNALSCAGKGPSFDDRSRDEAKRRPRQNGAPSSPQTAFYDFSITYTKAQRLTTIRVCSLLNHGIGIPLRGLRRVELHFGGRVRRASAELRRGLPGLLQAEPAAHRVRQLVAGVLDHR